MKLKLDRVEILSDSRCALSWIQRGKVDGPENCISKNSTLPEDRKNEVRREVVKIFDLISEIKHVEINQCKGVDQRADFGHKG